MPLNNPDYGDDHPAMEEPDNRLSEALAQARNQGPAPGANLEALPPAGPDPQVSRKYMKEPVQRGLDKYSTPRPPIERPEISQEISNPPPHEQAINDALDDRAAARAKKIHEEKMKDDFEYYLRNLQENSHQLF